MPNDPIPGWRVCCTCRETKEHADFPLRNFYGKPRLLTKCRACLRAYEKEYHKARREKRLQPALAKLMHARRTRETVRLSKDITDQFGGPAKFAELAYRVMNSPKTSPAGKLRVFQSVVKMSIVAAELTAQGPESNPYTYCSDEEIEATLTRKLKLLVASGQIKVPAPVDLTPAGVANWCI